MKAHLEISSPAATVDVKVVFSKGLKEIWSQIIRNNKLKQLED